MIELRIAGCCDRCEHIELRLKETVLKFRSEDLRLYDLKCIHEKVCGALAREKEAGDESS